MAISSSYNWTITKADLIRDAYEMAGIIGQEEDVSPEQTTTASRSLHMYMKYLQSKGTMLYNIEERTQSLTASSEKTGTDGLSNGDSQSIACR
jgi:hypothetical protein